MLLVPIVLYFFATDGRGRRASLEYLARLQRWCSAAPSPTLRQSFLHYLEFGQTLLDRLLLWQGRREEFQLLVQGREYLETERPSGMVLLGAHLGSFDVLRALATDLKHPIHVVMFRAHAQRINRVFREVSSDSDLRVIELAPGDINGVLQLKAHINRGEHLALLADRHPPGGKERVCSVPFLGENAPFPQSPWILASLMRCPVLMTLAVRTAPRSYRIVVRPIAEQIVLSRKNREEQLRPHVTVYARQLEELCRQYPRQWFNYFNFWQKYE
jgi:predicted LPLAT superfamily acyltransferase